MAKDTQPVELMGRRVRTIQTHNAVSVGASSNAYQVASANTNANGFMDCDGYDQLALSLLVDTGVATTNAYVAWSSDGVSIQGYEIIIATGNAFSSKAGSVSIKGRYAKIQAFNGDVAAHTMSAWAYLRS